MFSASRICVPPRTGLPLGTAGERITNYWHRPVWVLDQDSAKRFYTKSSGFEVRTDMSIDGLRWLTAGPKGAARLRDGLEAVFRDDSGNWFSLTERKT